MKVTTLPVSVFKAKCLRLLDEVAHHGHILIITKRGRPVARISPLRTSTATVRGSWKGLVEVRGDIVHFDASKDWESAG